MIPVMITQRVASDNLSDPPVGDTHHFAQGCLVVVSVSGHRKCFSLLS